MAGAARSGQRDLDQDGCPDRGQDGKGGSASMRRRESLDPRRVKDERERQNQSTEPRADREERPSILQGDVVGAYNIEARLAHFLNLGVQCHASADCHGFTT